MFDFLWRHTYLAIAVFGAIMLGIGALITWTVFSYWETVRPHFGSIAREPGHYRLINPILACEISDDQTEFLEYRPLQQQVISRIAEGKRKGEIYNASFYFRGMNRGAWVGVGENTDYLPASLAKTLIMMAYYRVASSDPALLSRKLRFSGSKDSRANRAADPAGILEAGKEYSIDDLIPMMIQTSSNDALGVLVNGAPEGIIGAIQEVYDDLGLKLPKTVAETNIGFVSPKTFALAFRVLYGSTYLSRAMSEKALDLLTKTTFKQGIAAGVPESMTVAHKFGITESSEHGFELHDCGIVYYPGYPYLFCIMTQGKKAEDSARLIQDISRLTYEFRKQQYPPASN